jgi:hypothetical protein
MESFAGEDGSEGEELDDDEDEDDGDAGEYMLSCTHTYICTHCRHAPVLSLYCQYG